MTFKISVTQPEQEEAPKEKMIALMLPTNARKLLQDACAQHKVRQNELVQQMIYSCLKDLGYHDISRYIKPLTAKRRPGRPAKEE